MTMPYRACLPVVLLSLILSACGGSSGSANGGDTTNTGNSAGGGNGGGNAANPEEFFQTRLQSSTGFCRTCHIAGGVADTDDGRGLMLTSDSAQDFQLLRASWEALGGGVDSSPLLIEPSDPAEPHSGGKPWPEGSQPYQAMRTLLTCWNDSGCSLNDGESGEPINLEPLLGSARGGHAWFDYCADDGTGQARPDSAPLPADPRSLVQPGFNDGRAVHFNAFWKDCHVDPALVNEKPHPDTCGQLRESRHRGAVLMGTAPVQNPDGSYVTYEDGEVVRPGNTFAGDNPHGFSAISAQQFNQLWMIWGLTERPDNFEQLVAERYGLGPLSDEHPYPLPGEDPNQTNGGSGRLPMGLLQTRMEDGSYSGEISHNCQGCHSTTIDGEFIPGGGGSLLDASVVGRDFGAFGSLVGIAIDRLGLAGRVRGTNNAQFSNILALTGIQSPQQLIDVLNNGTTGTGDTPAWWNVGRRPVKFVDAMFSGDAVRVDFALFSPILTNKYGLPEQEDSWTSDHVQDGDHYIMSQKAPEYIGDIDTALAEQGAILFHTKDLWAEGENNPVARPDGGNGSCASCHGAYSPRFIHDDSFLADPALEGIASYVVPIDIIDTDRVRLDTYNQGTNESLNQASVAYPETHGTDQDCGVQNLPGMQIDAQGNERPRGYAAPPLYGVWATAPYLHNGSVPDVWSLLDSSERPATWRRISKQPRADQAGQVVMGYETDFERGYDPQRMGWRYEEVDCDPSPSADYLSCNPLNDLGDFFLSEAYGELLLGWNIANPPILTNSDIEARKIYNTRHFSQGNGGHVFSDVLNDAEREAIIEYLKTL